MHSAYRQHLAMVRLRTLALPSAPVPQSRLPHAIFETQFKIMLRLTSFNRQPWKKMQQRRCNICEARQHGKK